MVAAFNRFNEEWVAPDAERGLARVAGDARLGEWLFHAVAIIIA
jgi:hypothetical protein